MLHVWLNIWMNTLIYWCKTPVKVKSNNTCIGKFCSVHLWATVIFYTCVYPVHFKSACPVYIIMCATVYYTYTLYSKRFLFIKS